MHKITTTKATLFFLLCFGLAVRIGYSFPLVFPFTFDHGKDALAVMHMLLVPSLKFIGPWTSIPGVHFGPAWYYFLAPFLALANFSPSGLLIGMILLGLVQIYIAFRFFGFFPALLIASTDLWLSLSRSAWNPFPLTLVSLLIMVLLQSAYKQKRIDTKQAFLFGFLSALGFHFSAAFAIFYLPGIALLFYFRKLSVTVRQLLYLCLGFGLPFVPQILFELKNNFLQTRSLLHYFQTSASETVVWKQIVSKVLVNTLQELRISFFPNTTFISGQATFYVQLLLLGIICFLLVRNFQNEKIRWYSLWSITFLSVSVLGFSFLHFNVWYVLGLVPFFTILVGSLFNYLPRKIQIGLALIYCLAALGTLGMYLNKDLVFHIESRQMITPKQKAIEYVYSRAQGKNFASYQYVPDVYDYSYQYLYFLAAVRGKQLPIEFSYQPGEISYVPEKQALLTKFLQQQGDPEVIFYIVEATENDIFLTEWWHKQRYGEIIGTETISPQLTIYEATPAN